MKNIMKRKKIIKGKKKSKEEKYEGKEIEMFIGKKGRRKQKVRK